MVPVKNFRCPKSNIIINNGKLFEQKLFEEQEAIIEFLSLMLEDEYKGHLINDMLLTELNNRINTWCYTHGWENRYCVKRSDDGQFMVDIKGL